MLRDQRQYSSTLPSADELCASFQMLQAYVGWTEDDARRLKSLKGVAERLLPGLIDDFYAEIQRHPEAMQVLTGGAEQMARLKRTLKQWLRELFAGRYDAEYVTRNWQIGRRHVQIGLPSIYMHAALARLRQGLMIGLQEIWPGEPTDLTDHFPALNRLLDLNLAMIDAGCQIEMLARHQRAAPLETRTNYDCM